MLNSIADRVASGQAGRRTADLIASHLRGERVAEPSADAESADIPAVIKAIRATEAAEADPRAAWNAAMAERGYSVWGEERAKLSDELGAAVRERMSLLFELAPVSRAKDNLVQNERNRERVSKTEPVPATELQGKAKDAAMKLIRQLGYPIGGPHDTTQFDQEGIRYIFYRDGRVEAHDADIPTSRAQKTQWLDMLDRQIALGRRDPSDLIARRDALDAQIDGLQAQLARRKG